ncbi:MAG TPA: SDR family NAD(P)-dependent oxidoreductase [Acidimicrobiales bacterium]|nr:SDR family NAD(P)-dependent oxidoreductase [Acidimicrobiales bacterium]
MAQRPAPRDDCRVLVVGGSSGIGRATALRFARGGARIALASRSVEALDAAATECRLAGAAEVACLPTDVNDADAVERAVAATVERFGAIDVTVHAAAVMAYGRIEDVPRQVFEHVVATSINGTANLARPLLAHYRARGRGHLVVVSSLLASVTAPTMGSYVAAKWGQLGLVRTLQQEVRDVPGIRISAVAPGGVSTPIYVQGGTYAGAAGTPPPPVYSADRVAAEVVARVRRPRRLSHAGLLNPLVVAGFRLLPALYDALVGPLLGRFGLADEPTAPTPGNVFVPRPDLEAVSGPWRGL